ncbi:integral membrane family protein [Salix suchowensis]|nr:integral membrane family protein [Salix suchowensis]
MRSSPYTRYSKWLLPFGKFQEMPRSSLKSAKSGSISAMTRYTYTFSYPSVRIRFVFKRVLMVCVCGAGVCVPGMSANTAGTELARTLKDTCTNNKAFCVQSDIAIILGFAGFLFLSISSLFSGFRVVCFIINGSRFHV